MKKSATKLMKELKGIEQEIARLHKEEEITSIVPVDCDYNTRYESDYSYESTRKELEGLYKRRAAIKSILTKFNFETKVDGYEFTMTEALVELAQLKCEAKQLRMLASRTTYTRGNYESSFRGDEVGKVSYDLGVVKSDLKKLEEETSALQVAIDKTNLNSLIDC